MKRILLLEDEENLLDSIKLNLELEGFSITTAVDGKEAVDKFKQGRFDLLILDIMVPFINGFDVAEQVRLANKEIPILFLTARSTTDDKLKGLNIGDDYLTKPFNLDELIIRVKNLLNRGYIAKDIKKEITNIFIGNSTINTLTYEYKGVNNITGKLSKKEILLLKLMYNKKEQVVSREEILEKVWGYDVYPSTRTIDNYILAFRKYFENEPKKPIHFHSIRGVGYKLTT
jgi:two-component system, OmpR family, alkaline phosphatase synthesis response regulator PhoP